MDSVKKFVVYVHIRLDLNQLFYVGVSNNKFRPYSTTRNRLWKNIVEKTDYDTLIIWENLTEEEALAKEVDIIAIYGNIYDGTGILSNMTKGGDYNTKYADRKKSSAILSANTKRLWNNPEWRTKVLNTMKTNRNTPEYKKEASERLVARFKRGDMIINSEESRRKISERNTQIFNTPEWKARRSRQAKENKSIYNPTISVFKHKLGCIFVGTQFELKSITHKQNASNIHLIFKNPNRTWHGWSFIKSLPSTCNDCHGYSTFTFKVEPDEQKNP
jgi:hypothetical protein